MTTRTDRNPFGARDRLDLGAGESIAFYRLAHLERSALAPQLASFPVSIKILLEAVLRHCGTFAVGEEDIRNLARWNASAPKDVEVPFKPARVILQDFTGVPVLVDLAAMRSAVKRLGGDPKRINPLVPVDLVIDHSVQVDVYGRPDALAKNAAIEFRRNRERYEFLRWGQNSVKNFRAVPPATGIVHQVNLEHLAQGVMRGDDGQGPVAYPDTLVGTDSHTTMINGLGVVGWGVGGIEAEAVMLGQPLFLVTPQVVGFRLHGRLRPGVTATDLTLTVTQMLRNKGVVDKFVEFYGPGLSAITLADRATIANMAPEYGATMGYFPPDAESVEYLCRTGRPEAVSKLAERYWKEQGLFRTDATPDPVFSDAIDLDLGSVEPSLAGPKRPQDRVALAQMAASFKKSLTAPVVDRGFGLAEAELGRAVETTAQGARATLAHGSVVIAAITSCTNTSNPSVMIGAGLLARNAVARGLSVPPYVKTSLAPGSRVVTEYLRESGLLADLEALRFHVVGYGCTTCIGNSGPLADEIATAITDGKLVAVAVLSGNRNFEGRINPHTKANYLASPPLVVAYALAGTVDRDLTREPLGVGRDGRPVFLKDIWPTPEAIAEVTRKSMRPAMFEKTYADVFRGTPEWNSIAAGSGELYPWNASSTYIQEPPFFEGVSLDPKPFQPVRGARCLALLGDSVTTDHISPAGDIAADSPAGRYLVERGVAKPDFNSYGSRRGNDRVMVRGTFANIRLKNQLVPGVEGGVTVHFPSGERMAIYDAAQRYAKEGVPLVVLAGKEYGAGSSRDWAAKGTLLLGVRAVIAEGYERIHRSNLVGMGVLPLQYRPLANAGSLGLTGSETFHIDGISNALTPRQEVTVRAVTDGGAEKRFEAIARVDSGADVEYLRHGGILPMVVRQLVRG